jgi:hypothetical protein
VGPRKGLQINFPKKRKEQKKTGVSQTTRTPKQQEDGGIGVTCPILILTKWDVRVAYYFLCMRFNAECN